MSGDNFAVTGPFHQLLSLKIVFKANNQLYIIAYFFCFVKCHSATAPLPFPAAIGFLINIFYEAIKIDYLTL